LFIFANGFFLSIVLSPQKSGVLERLVLTVGLGFGVTFAVMALVGVFWVFSFFSVALIQTVTFLVLFSAAVLRGFRVNFNTLPRLKPASVQLTNPYILCILLLSIIFLLAFYAFFNAVTLPAVEWDSLAYGVNYAKIIYQNGNVPLIAGPSIGIEMSAAYPPGVQLTAVSMYAFAGEANDFYYRVLSPIFSLATLIVVYNFSRILNKDRVLAVYAVTALVLTPFFWELFLQETYLTALTFMLTLCAFFFYKARSSAPSDTRKYEIIGALFCGFASLTSYIGLLSFGIMLLYAVHQRLTAKRLAPLVILAVVIMLPWYIRNFILLGDPVYPFLGVGNYLDPLLRSSTLQHFQHYTLLPVYWWTALLCKVGAVLLGIGLLFFTFSSKKRDFKWAMPLYLVLVSVGIMALHVAFPRYVVLALPVLAVVFSTLIKGFPKRFTMPKATSVIIISLIVLTSFVMVFYINTVKPSVEAGEDKAKYLSRLFEEGDAWQWINTNTPSDVRIATFDIKEYYLNRSILTLDGKEAAPLYQMDTIQESMAFLQDHAVGYILSVPWASSNDTRQPPAYTWCPLTKHLGDPEYFPAVFVGKNGTTIYHVGEIAVDTIYQSFAEKNLAPPLKHVTVNLTISDTSKVTQCYVPIPVDYRAGNITMEVICSKPLGIELWNEVIPTNQMENPMESPSKNFIIANSTLVTGFDVPAPVLSWVIDKGGYFTIRLVDREKSLWEPINLVLNIYLYSPYDLAPA
jgi:hypothetical protein